MSKYLFKNKQKSCLHRTHPPLIAHVILQQVWCKLLLFYAFFCSNCLLRTNNIPCVFVYLYLVLVTVNVYGILMWTSKNQSEPESYWSLHKSIGFPLTTRSYFCAGAHAHIKVFTHDDTEKLTSWTVWGKFQCSFLSWSPRCWSGKTEE